MPVPCPAEVRHNQYVCSVVEQHEHNTHVASNAETVKIHIVHVQMLHGMLVEAFIHRMHGKDSHALTQSANATTITHMANHLQIRHMKHEAVFFLSKQSLSDERLLLTSPKGGHQRSPDLRTIRHGPRLCQLELCLH